MLNKFHHVAISVNDIDKSLAFYRDVLGFKVFHDVEIKDKKTMEQVAKIYGMTHIPGAVHVRTIFMGKEEWGRSFNRNV